MLPGKVAVHQAIDSGITCFDTAEASRIGFLDRTAEDPVAAARDFSGALAKNAPLSIAGAKTILNGLAQGTGALDFTKAHEVIERAMLSEDYREGQRAFLERRQADWSGH